MADCVSMEEQESVEPFTDCVVTQLVDELVDEVLRREENSDTEVDVVVSDAVVEEEVKTTEVKAEEEEQYCRVCHGESEPGRELYYPCKCDGSIKYIHQDCLIEWIKHSRQKNPRCELCKEPFKFKNIYKQGAPLRLTILELIKELLPRFFGIIWWVVNIVLTFVLWGLVLPLFTNVWLKYSWCVICDQHPPLNCSDHFSTFLAGFDQRNWYEIVEHVTQNWFSGISHLCTIVIFSFIAFEVFRVLLQEALQLEKEHVARLVQHEVSSCFKCLREIDESNEQVVVDLFALLRKCLHVEAMFLPLGNILPEEDQNECKEKWCMTEEESLVMEHRWLTLRRACQAAVAPHPNQKLHVDRETGKIDGEVDLVLTLKIDLESVTIVKQKLDEFGSECRLPILSSLHHYCDRIRDMCQEQLKTIDFSQQNAVSRHANILLIYCQGMLKITHSLRKYRNDVEVSLDKFITEIRQSELVSKSDVAMENEPEDNFEMLLRSHMEFEQRLQEEQRRRPEPVGESTNGEEETIVENDGLTLTPTIQQLPEAVEEFVEEESMFRDVDSASETEDQINIEELSANESQNIVDEEEAQTVEELDAVTTNEATRDEMEEEGHVDHVDIVGEDVLDEENSREIEQFIDNLLGLPADEPQANDEVHVLEAADVVNEGGQEAAAEVEAVPNDLNPVQDAVAAQAPGAAVPRFEQDHGLLRLGYSRWLLCMGYIITFTAVFLVFPAVVGIVITTNTVQMKTWMDSAHLVIKEVFQQDGNVALAAKLLDYSDDISTGLDTDQDFVSEIYLAKLKTIFEILLGYSFIVCSTLACYVLYCTKYLTSLQWNFSMQNMVVDGFKQVVDFFTIVVKSVFTILLTFLLMPSMLAVVAYKSIYPNLSSAMKDSLEQSDAALLILAFFLYVISLMVMFHSVFVAAELRKLLKPAYLKDFLPQETVFEQVGDAAQGQVNAHLNRIQNKVANKTFLELFRNFVLRLCVVFPGMLITVVIPLRLGHVLSFTFTALVFRFRSTMSDVQIPVEMVMSHILLPLLIDRLKYTSTLRTFLSFVVHKLAASLKIESVLKVEEQPVVVMPLAPAPVEPVNDPALEAVPAEQIEIEDHDNNIAANAALANEVREAPVVDTSSLGNFLSPDAKFSLLIFGTLLTFTLISSWLLHLPMWIGRGLLFHLKLPANNDFFNYPAGLVVTWGLGFVGQFIIKDIVQSADGMNVLSVAWKWIKLIFQILVAGVLWLGWPPLLVGYALECLAIFPFRTTFHSTPQFPFLQSWALGLILLKLFVRSVLTGVFGEVDLRNQLEMLMIRGFQNFEFHHFFFKVYLPIVIPLMDLVCIPFFLARWVGMYSESYLIRTLLVRYSMHIYIGLRCLWSLLCTLVQYLVNLHNEIRDTRYLLGTELANRK